MSDLSTYKRHGMLTALAAGAIFAVSQQAGAAAFAIKEQSTSYMANAFAGTTSSCLDAATGYYNPATLGELKTNQLVASLIYVDANIKLYNATATNNAGQNVTGNNQVKPASSALVPGMHLAWRLNNKFSAGLSVIAPFGLSTKYNSAAISRYIGTKSSLQTVDVSPSLSYKINDQFSVGAAFDAMHVKAVLASSTNFGGAEGYLNNNGSGWAYGYHVGVLYKPSTITKMGLAYFSRFSPRLAGDVQSANVPGAARTSVTTKANLPDRIVYSITHQYTDVWTAMGEVEWTHWSRLKTLRLNYNSGSSSTENFYYTNAFRFSLGTDYKYKQNLTLKGGLAYEQTPVNKVFLSSRLPDADRYWLALGAKYVVNRNISIDAAYAHLFSEKANNAQGRAETGGFRTLFGNYRSSADLVGIQLTWNFV